MMVNLWDKLPQYAMLMPLKQNIVVVAAKPAMLQKVNCWKTTKNAFTNKVIFIFD